MYITLSELKKIIRETIRKRNNLWEVVTAGEIDPDDMRVYNRPEDNYRPDALEYLGMNKSPYPEDNYRPTDNYRAEDPLAYLGFHRPDTSDVEDLDDEDVDDIDDESVGGVDDEEEITITAHDEEEDVVQNK